MKKILARTAAISLLGAAAGLTGVAPASAAPMQPTYCAADPYDKVTQTAVYYSSIGSTVGKYNSSSTTEPLAYSLAATTTRSTALQAGANMSLSWGIAEVQANVSYTVTNTTSSTWTATNTMNVPGHYYGYMTPKVEYRTYHITQWETPGNCGSDVQSADYGYINAIVVYPFFSECTATSSCTPKP